MVDSIIIIFVVVLLVGYLFLVLRWIYLLPRSWGSRYVIQGNQLLEQGHFDNAITVFTRVIDKQPENTDAYLGRSHAYIRVNELDKALSDCDTIIQLQPDNHFAFLNRGAIYSLNENYQQAVVETTHCLELESAFLDGLFNRACYYSELGKTEEALADFAKAIQLLPSDIDNYTERGNLYIKTKHYAKAIDDYTRAIELGDQPAELLTARGYTYLKMEAFEKAQADFEHAIRSDAEARHAMNCLAWLLATCPVPKYRDGNKALKLALRNCELADTTAWNDLGTLAAAYAEVGQFDEAIRWINESMAKAPELELHRCEAQLTCFENQKPYTDHGTES